MPISTRNLIGYLSEIAADGATAGNYPVTKTHRVHLDTPDFAPLFAASRVIETENVLTSATINIGFNPPNFDNVVRAQLIGALVGVTQLPLNVNAAIVPADLGLTVRVTIAAIPQPLTRATLRFRVVLVGYDVEF